MTTLTTNFVQLQLLGQDNRGFEKLFKLCSQAEQYASFDPDSSASKSRKALETLVKIIYKIKDEPVDENAKLRDLLSHYVFANFVDADSDIIAKAHIIRRIGNHGVHEGQTVSDRDARNAVYNLYMVVSACLLKMKAIKKTLRWDPKKMPKVTMAPIVDTPDITPEETQVVVDAVPEAKTNTEHIQLPEKDELSEQETREIFIDMLLREAGWEVMTKKGHRAASTVGIEIEVEGMPNESGKGYVDYVMFGPDGTPLGLIEAKKASVSEEVGRHQAMLYADCLERKYGYRPAIFVSNGLTIKYIDGLGYPDRNLYGFHSEKDLIYLKEKRGRALITDMKPNRNIADRDYQQSAVKAVCEHFNKMNRRALLVMATGTGKTRTAISLVEILTRNNWAKHVLFLADRTALVNQAYGSFVDNLPSETKSVLSEEREPNLNARILFSTYQTMINYVDKEKKPFSVGHFDLIIIDEAHRSVFGKYGTIFDYFDSLLVGLTATPRDEIEKSTFDLMNLEGGEPNFAYEYEEAIKDKKLVPYKTVIRHSDILERGVKYNERTEEEKRQLEAIYNKMVEDARLDPDAEIDDDSLDLKAKDIFKVFYNRDTISKMLDDLMDNGLRVQGNEMVGKTIIFAYNHKTAELIVNIFREKFPEYGENFCQLIDNYVKYSQSLIDSFSVQDKMPQIAVSVDMLDTGIDVPSMLNLVFFKVVHSKIKFLQMIGRGTRLCNNLFGPGHDKKEFYIFDYGNNFEYFSTHAQGAEPMKVVSLTERMFGLRLDIAYNLQAATYQENAECKKLHDELKQKLHEQLCTLDDSRIAVRKVRPQIYDFRKPERWEYISEIDVRVLHHDAEPILPRTMNEEMALRFDIIMYEIVLGKLAPQDGQDRKAIKCQNKVVSIGEALEKRASIPQIMEKMETIRLIQTSAFWESAGVKDLEQVRQELRDLIKYLDGVQDSTGTMVVDFADEITTAESETEVHFNSSFSYKEKVLDYLDRNLNSEAIRKIYDVEKLTTEDLMELERIFWQELGSREDYEAYIQGKVYGNIAAFIRSIIKIDRQKALERYRQMIVGAEMNSQQETYLKNILDYVCANGDIDLAKLNQPPFNRMNFKRTFGDDLSTVMQFVRDLHNAIDVA